MRRSRREGRSVERGEERLRIGIIGAGSIGSTIARRLARRGHDVVIANPRGPERRDLAIAVIGEYVRAGGDASDGRFLVAIDRACSS